MQNLVTCQYETKLAGLCRHVTITWLKNVKGKGVSVTIDDPSCQYTCKVKMNPWSFWNRYGVKSIEVSGHKVDVFWDLSNAKYAYGPEPKEGFYVAVVSNEEMVLLLGDKVKEAYKQTRARPPTIEPALMSRKEHVFGNKQFFAKAQFSDSGKAYDIVIECQTNTPKDPYLYITVDKQLVVQVKNLEWKFRGNQTVFVDGIPVEVFWDVHNWIFNSPGNTNKSNAIFIFQASTEPEKLLNSKASAVKWSGDLNGRISVMKLAGARSLRSSQDLVGMRGYSLMLHAWKSD
ncbi:hypothetical protein KP509_13G025100 [Ceratopteris richardii]|uniref:Ig-like domain-containing protein n=2 Tax=Ceratopteris richardii TaxID=49495 RepID=A0A8T2THE7_CERRI|nr:hypothetical protein KP509_13G025100 [Ceratopteris richardii]KAH7420835.1 hypothetical protein KP509_13G025100 [Ceratopteris richardii]